MDAQDPLSRAEQSSGPSDDSPSPKIPQQGSSQGPGGSPHPQAGEPATGSGRVDPGDGTGGSDAGGGPASEEASETSREHSGGQLNRR